MPKIEKYERVEQVFDKDGNLLSEKTTNKTKRIVKMTEPDYIKLYTQIWSDPSQNKIPISYRPLFLELASRMSYCDAGDLGHSQLVMTGAAYQDSILRALGLCHRDSLQKGLKALCDCNAIRRIQKGIYQVNPRYAAKGQWKYNPMKTQSSLEEFIAYYEEEKEKAEKKKAKKPETQETEKPSELDLNTWNDLG